MSLIVDAHEDIASAVLSCGRNYLNSAYDIRRSEAGGVVEAAAGVAMLGLPEWLRGRVAVVFGTLWTLPERKQVNRLDAAYRTPGEAHQQARQQMEVYERLAAESAHLKLIHSRADLEAVLKTWEFAEPRDGEPDRRQVGIVCLMEGGDPIQEPAEVAMWYEWGLRLIGPAWAGTRYCGGTSEPGPLTDAGVQLLSVMQDHGLILDVSHMAEEAFFQALDLYRGPIIASHSNPRTLTNNLDRHLTDEMIKTLIDREAVIGTVVYNKFLVRDWNPGDPKEAATVDTVARAIDHVCQIAGDARHAAIGSDFDGGFGMQSAPAGFDTVADLQIIGPALSKLGFSPEDIDLILGGNWLRKLRGALPQP